MITQEITYYPDTFKTKEYKEYYNGVLNVHSKYDENNNKVYMYLAYDNLEWERKFEEGTINDHGEIIYYKDNKGCYTKVTDSLEYTIRPRPGTGLFFDVNVHNTSCELILKTLSEFRCGAYITYYYEERLPNGDLLKYNQNYFQEIYYEYWVYDFDREEYLYTGNRKIISFDELMELTQFKDFLVEQKVCPVTSRYLLNTVRKKTAENLFFSK